MAGYGREALEELRDVVREAKQGDPLAPVTVLVPSNIAGIVARRFLARGLGDGHHGVAALYPTTIARLAEQLAAPSLHDRRPATGPVVAAAWRSALEKDAGIFHSVKDHPATVQALVRAGRELRDMDAAALDALGAVQPLGGDLVRLHRSVVAELSAGWYDQTDLLHVAAEICRRHPEKAAEIGTVVLYLPQSLTQAESAFVAALGADSTVHVVGLTGQPKADAAVHRSLSRIGASAPAAPTRPPTATRVLTASDADDEVRCVVREVVEALTRHPAHRVVVLYSAQNPYARLLHEHLGAAGITINGPGTRPIHERAVARAILGLLDLAGTGPERDVPRGDLFRVLATAPMRARDGERVPVARWERLSRSAGVVSGPDWDKRLTVFLQEERDRLADEEARDDVRPGVVARLNASIINAERLRSFVADLRERLAAARGLTSWRELSDWALQLMHQLIGQAEELTALPPEEQYAAVAVEQALRGVAVLDSFDGARAGLTELHETVASQLEAALPRVGRFGDGVLVAPVSAAIGLEADAVFVLGLAEATFPGRLREDPLLPERAREAAGGQLVGYRERLDEKHRHLLAAFAAAPDVLASFPRGDLRTKSQHLPSRWLLPTMKALSGRPDLSATKWDAQPTDWMLTSASFAGSLVTTPRPASEQEWRTQAAHARTAPPDPVAEAAHALLRARASSQFTRYDGDLTGVDDLPDHADGTAVISPTALEKYARCPHAYFIERLLGVAPIELPEDVITISPADIGTLMHNSFDRLVREFAGRLPDYGEPWTEAQQQRLAAIAQEEADRFAAEGRTGHPRLWEQTLSRIKADLRAMLIADDEWRAEHRAAVIASELAFGMRGAEPVAIPIPDGGTVLMRGAADKVDRDVDGRLYVTDIKSGSARDFQELDEANPVAGGTKLQLPVYAHAARAAYDPEAEVEAAYWFVRRDKGRIEVPLTEAVERTYAETLQTIITGIRRGLFPARSPVDPDFAYVQCAYCNPDGIGHAEARRRWEQKKSDPRLADVVALIEPLPDTDGGAA
ncbi:PD-(D/E)XK nuclease family protein [Blastococcus sp. CCUG 61487]|uniref:PD-(D/E)XK nuclease family protein n=1 Tax=Blastococcus sp. CCUG 61487 TaxID=1840703 RepID=UPI0010C0A728|nr:PD-(D/E)XK nuclease family protein [Blastococcus sp. CCUG 61487]TKJ28389.1 ATP-dependent nuclease subunit B [Blastococcus sp. CCUG 61487]